MVVLRLRRRPDLQGNVREQLRERAAPARRRATKTITNLGYPEDRLSLSPTGDGPSLVVRGHWNRHYTYTVPGDRSSRVLTEVGAVYVALERAVCDHLT
jgi:hypothetical protein